MSTFEFDYCRLDAKSSGPNPKEPGGGEPIYSNEEIRACLAEVPHLAWHCILAKFHSDQRSEREVLRRLKMMSIAEWFTNPEHATKSIKAGQLNRVAELALLSWLNPRCAHSQSTTTRAAYVEMAHGTWRANFQGHYAWLLSELDYLERLADSAYRKRKYGPREGDDVAVTECPACGQAVHA